MIIIILSICSLAVTFFYAFLILFLRSGWQKIPYFNKNSIVPHTKISVLIAARNEEEKIHLTIEDILAQNYPKELMEIIIVDDHSTDRTSEIIGSYESQGVKLIKLNEKEPLNSYKKKAIAEAIKLSEGELIIATDADCRMKPDWLVTIVNMFETGNYNLISSPVVYFEEKSLFERLQTLEFLCLIGLGAAGIGNKMPSTCNGANLAYKKSVFVELGGFKGIDELASGDDELFLHKVAFAHPGTIGFCKSADAIVFTHGKPNLKEFIQQRKRWASKSVKYKDKKLIFVAVAVWLFNISLLTNLIMAFFYPDFLKLVAVQFTIKFISELFFLDLLTNFVKRKHLVFHLFLLTFLHPLYLIYIGFAGNSGKYNWKDRMVN
ncbi:glycosyl transferase [Pedobacter psychrophilus]|uniref:Glycosyl transferase n=1 Tax=Pedobacter psychrophilus TaxID=1826909 RepID=A0A179DDV5_9SPHI|nr:glycosyl transferase [Pedobacter psychrophilus]